MKWSKILLTLVVILTVLIPTVALADSWVLYENYTTIVSVGDSSELYLSNYFAQTFTVGSVRHTVDRIRLNLSGEGTTGNLYVSIRATNASAYPNGLDLSTGAIAGTGLVVSTTAGSIYEIPMTPIVLEANTSYAVVCYGSGTSSANNIHWFQNNASTYTGGSYWQSNTGGINWWSNSSRDFMFQIWGTPANSSIQDVKVFTGYRETGDWLITTINYINGSCDAFAYPWYMQLIDTTTDLACGVSDKLQCGMRPASIYLSAASTASLTWGGSYYVNIYGNYGALPNATRTINATDWQADIISIENWVRQWATTMQVNDATTYITTVPEWGYVLNMDGGNLFDIGIPYLSTYHPDIFQVTEDTVDIGYIFPNGSTDYADDLYTNWAITLGPNVSGVLTTAAPYFGFTGVDGGRMVGALLTLMGFLSLAIIEKSVAFMVILGGVLIGVFPMATVLMLVFILAVVLIRSLFWSST